MGLLAAGFDTADLRGCGAMQYYVTS
jgi:hypothetical protein